MKKFRISLLWQVLIAIATGIALGQFLPVPVARIFVIIHLASAAQQPCGGDEHHQLAADGDGEAEHAVAQCLKHRAEHDARARQQDKRDWANRRKVMEKK